MSGTAEVLALLRDVLDRLWFLAPNLRGAQEAVEAGARNVVCVVSATESHSRSNLGRPVSAVVRELGEAAAHLAATGVRARVALSMAWVDPDEGAVPLDRVVGLCGELAALGFRELTLCDTHGGASPRAVTRLLEEVFAIFPVEAVGLHLHDTYGLAMVNTLTGLLLGVRRHDGSVGGLGGCPFAEGASGNLATERLVTLLASLGVETGVSMERLLAAREKCFTWLRRDPPHTLLPPEAQTRP